MKEKLVVFSHGQESGPWGSKIKALAEAAGEMGFAAESVDYRGMADADERADKLADFCRAETRPIILAGSSMGGYVAARAALDVPALGLFLMAPDVGPDRFALDDAARIACPVTVVHGWRDEVLPPEGSFAFAKAARAKLHLIDDGHRLKGDPAYLGLLFRAFLAPFVSGLPGGGKTG